MLLWLGVSAKWQQRSFWTSANLMASVFYGSSSIHSGFAWSTVAGIALYLFLYGVLGALFVMALRGRINGKRTILAGMCFALAWYYFSFHLLWKVVMPLVALLHTERPMVLGHLLYGAVLGRFPVYLNLLEPPPPAEPAEEAASPDTIEPGQEQTSPPIEES